MGDGSFEENYSKQGNQHGAANLRCWNLRQEVENSFVMTKLDQGLAQRIGIRQVFTELCFDPCARPRRSGKSTSPWLGRAAQPLSLCILCECSSTSITNASKSRLDFRSSSRTAICHVSQSESLDTGAHSEALLSLWHDNGPGTQGQSVLNTINPGEDARPVRLDVFAATRLRPTAGTVL